MSNPYDARYASKEYYWGLQPSTLCHEVLRLLPPTRRLRLLDIGCGEGRNAVFFARNGYEVTAVDLSPAGVEKTRFLAEQSRTPITALVADLREFCLAESYDIIFSTGALHYLPQTLRARVIADYRAHTTPGGVNAINVFVHKPFLKIPPDTEDAAPAWYSGELFLHYHDWRIEYCVEEIFDCQSSGVPHQHCVNRMIARRVG